MKTDAQLKREIAAELRLEVSLDALQIRIEVHDGIVTLAGHVSSYTERGAATRAARRVSGVRALAIELDVNHCGPSKRDDTLIARSACEVLRSSHVVPQETIQVLVDAGRITLSGEVDWNYQRTAATDSIRSLVGMAGFSDQIVVKTQVGANISKSGQHSH